MKNLTILRHGKAARAEDYAVDFERPLTKRGLSDLDLVAGALVEFSPKVDWVMSSPAFRARQSTEYVAGRLAVPDQPIWEHSVYDGGPEALLSLVERVPAEKQHALIVGHNPALEQLLSGLCAGATSRFACSLPTSGVASVELQIMWWEQVRWGSGQLRLFLRPRLLRRL